MKRLPEIKSNCKRITDLYYRAVSSRLLITALRLNIFDHLEKFTTAEQIAYTLSLDPNNTAHVLNALCACELIEKNGEKYKNTTETSELLVAGKPAYLGEWLNLTDEDVSICLEKLPKIIRSGPSVLSRKDHMNSEALCERFTVSHAASSLAGIARDIAREISAVQGFTDCHRFLDLGGGPGINAMAVAEKYDKLTATIMDRPEIVKFTRHYIRKYGFEKQIEAVAGDYLQDPIGSGYDMIMITDSLYYPDQEIDTVLKKCHDALNPCGFLVGIHAVLTHARTQPPTMVLGMLSDAISNQGMLPDQGFFEHALIRCKFKNLSSKMVVIGGISMEMNIGHIK